MGIKEIRWQDCLIGQPRPQLQRLFLESQRVVQAWKVFDELVLQVFCRLLFVCGLFRLLDLFYPCPIFPHFLFPPFLLYLPFLPFRLYCEVFLHHAYPPTLNQDFSSHLFAFFPPILPSRFFLSQFRSEVFILGHYPSQVFLLSSQDFSPRLYLQHQPSPLLISFSTSLHASFSLSPTSAFCVLHTVSFILRSIVQAGVFVHQRDVCGINWSLFDRFLALFSHEAQELKYRKTIPQCSFVVVSLFGEDLFYLVFQACLHDLSLADPLFQVFGKVFLLWEGDLGEVSLEYSGVNIEFTSSAGGGGTRESVSGSATSMFFSGV